MHVSRNEAALNPGERIDDLQRNGLRIIQNPERFCFGMDAVLLSGFAEAREGETVLDLGTGTGILPLLLSAKTEAEHITGLELQPDSAAMAERSVRMNGLSERIEIVTGDLKTASERFGAASFSVVTTNPPYMPVERGLTNPEDAKAIARHELCCTLEDVLRESARLLKVNGRFYMVHRPFRLAEILIGMRGHGIEPKRLRLVYPYSDKEPNMVLIEGRRGGKPNLVVERPLIIYREQGVYTDELREDYGF